MIISLAMTILSLSAFVASGKDDIFQYRDLVECRARGGLPNFFKKCRDGANVRIAYFGGSITEQEGWRVQSLELFQKLFPNAKFSEIHAAIGGTDSAYGVVRAGADVIKHKPDLVFVEFAVNDGLGGTRSMWAMEGIVRQIWKADPNCDICFVYTLKNMSPTIDAICRGKMHRSSHYMENVADLYNIPSINFAKSIADLLKEDKIVMNSSNKPLQNVAGNSLNVSCDALLDKDGKIPFSKDGVHPYPNTGHRLYTASIARSIAPIAEASKQAVAHELPKPMFADTPEKITTVPIEEIKSAQKYLSQMVDMNKFPFSIDKKKLAGKGYIAFKPNDEISFKVKANRVHIVYLGTLEGGYFEVQVDNNKPSRRQAFSRWSKVRHYIATTIFEEKGEPKEHTIRIKVLDEDSIPEKRKLLQDVDKDPTNPRYSKNVLHIGTIYIIGDLLE